MNAMAPQLVENLHRVGERIAVALRRAGRSDAVTLVGVTKNVTAAIAGLLVDLGVRDLGENRPQELWKKQDLVPDARWHLIGHLQRNKIEKTVPLCALIHSVDSLRLLAAIDAFSQKQNAPVRILLEFNCSGEAAKGGFAPADLPILAEQLPGLSGVHVVGLMTMAALDGDPRPAFAECRRLRDELQTRTGMALPHLSMGMSNDFEVAIEEGATLVRLGTVLYEGM
jgi:PLP dependent protein